MENHLSRIKIGEPPDRANDELSDATLFKVDYVHEWYLRLVEYLMSGRPLEDISTTWARKLIRLARPYQLITRQLYIWGKDDVIRRCVLLHEVGDLLIQAHDGITGGHFASEMTTRKVL